MIETKHCLSGHDLPVYEFGRDVSKPDGLNLRCRNCVKNERINERNENEERGLNRNGSLSSESEATIERNRLKRIEEQRIAAELSKEEESETFEIPARQVFPFVRKPTEPIKPRWSCY